MNRIGGVNRDISDPDAIVAELRAIGRLVERDIVPSLMESRTAMARMRGVGVLTLGQAIDRGVVGPVARASSAQQRVPRPVSFRSASMASTSH
jgi:Ni,Fe-hydrogenase III large subunit